MIVQWKSYRIFDKICCSYLQLDRLLEWVFVKLSFCFDIVFLFDIETIRKSSLEFIFLWNRIRGTLQVHMWS